jgi:putative salt-induced outer membrane protein
MTYVDARNALFVVAAIALTAAHPAYVLAADWTGKAQAGLVIAGGNTDTKNANAKLDLATTVGSWKHAVGAAALYASADDISTGQRWEVYEQSDYNFSERSFWFGAARYEDDRFSGFEYQATLSTGLGRHFIDSDRTKLTGTLGVGYKIFETRDTYDEDTGLLLQTGESDSQAVMRGTVDFTHNLTGTAQLFDKFLAEAGSDNTSLQNDIGIQVKISDVLALAAAYSVRYNSDPPLGFGKSDTLTTLNLVYEMK